MSIRAVLFDLDGTLVDSALDLAASVNIVLAEAKLGPLTVGQVRRMIGNGVRTLVERAFAACDAPEGDLDVRTARMLDVYGAHSTVLTALMPGTIAALDWCRSNGLACAVVTNKPEAPARAIMKHCGIEDYFHAVIGGDSGYPLKPAPDALFAAIRALDAAPADTLMVGDSPADVAAARAAGIAVLAVSGGYTNLAVDRLGADHALATLAELGDALARWE